MRTVTTGWMSLLGALLILGSVTAIAESVEKGLTADVIDSLILSMDEAWATQDVEGILLHLAPDYTMILDLEEEGRRVAVQYNREAYATHLTETFAGLSQYQGTQKFKKIELFNEGRIALVTLQYRESMYFGEMPRNSFSQYIMVVQAGEKGPLIASAQGVVIQIK